jgi:putative transposase
MIKSAQFYSILQILTGEMELEIVLYAVGRNGVPEKITIDKSGTNTAAIVSYNADHGTAVEIRQVKYLNNIVE